MSLVQEIKNPKTLAYFLDLDASLNSYMISSYFESEGILKLASRVIGPILEQKGITREGIQDFCEKFQKNTHHDDFSTMFTHFAAPPFDLFSNLNQVKNIQEMCTEVNLENYHWITTHKFPGNANVGSFEAFLITLFNKMSNPTKGGDVMFNNKDIIEVKGSSGRLRGQRGYNNGLIPYIQELLTKMGFDLPKDYLSYNITRDTVNVIDQKLIQKEFERLNELGKYKEKLEGKKQRLVDASTNTKTKKYLKAKEQYDKYNAVLPRSIIKLDEEITKLKNDRDNCTLENVSIELAEKSLDDSVDFLVKIFARKYSNADNSEIEDFVRAGLNPDGSFSDTFLLEYFIFEFSYYKFIEDFKYFCLVNLKDETMLIVDSVKKFREFAYDNVITIKSSPSFSDFAGQQGMVFALELKG